MFILIIAIVIALGLFILLGLTFDKHDDIDGFKLNKRQLLALLPFLICLFNLFAVIPANTVGVQYSPFAGVNETTLPEGMHVKGFFDKIYKISTEIQTKKIENVIGQTRDAQYIAIVLDVKYQVSTRDAFNVFRQFRTLNSVDTNLITPMVQRSVEAITTQYDIIEVLGEKRNEVYKGIEDDLKTRLASNGINLHSITMTDTDAGDAIEAAIQQEAVAKKQVETAEQERNKAKIESEKRVIEAEADKLKAEVEAQTQLIKAKADAEAKVIAAEGNAKALESVNKYLTPEALQKMWVDKWNGQLPQVSSGDNGLILDMKGTGK